MACPGYPYENCGDQAAGLFGYVALGPSPSGTQGSAASSSAGPSSNPPIAYTSSVVSTPCFGDVVNIFSFRLLLLFRKPTHNFGTGPFISDLDVCTNFMDILRCAVEDGSCFNSKCTECFSQPGFCDRAGYGHSITISCSFLCFYSMA